MNASLSLHHTAVQYARKLIGANTSQSAESFNLAKTLDRAALLLHAIIYRVRLHASPLRFKSVRLEGSIIYLDGFSFDGFAIEACPRPFWCTGPCVFVIRWSRSWPSATVYLSCLRTVSVLSKPCSCCVPTA